MSFQVTIQPSGQTFSANSDQNLLQAGLDAGLLLPYGCRTGACGVCKGKVLSGEVRLGSYAPHSLPENERAAGTILFCCTTAQSDLTIECTQVSSVPEIPIRKLPCRVISMDKVADDVIVLKLQLPAQERFNFYAGQYIDFILADGQKRSFSLANAPDPDAPLEVHIRLIPGGRFTTQVFTTLKVRDILRFEGPLGSFFLRNKVEEGGDKPVILLAGGTGFAPLKGIVEQAIREGSTRPMSLYWGAKDVAGLYLAELAQSWAAQLPHFNFVPVISDPQANPAWAGRTGLVHHAVLADFADLSGHQVYACGAPPMIEAAKTDFVSQRQLPADQFFADAFTFTPQQ
jgi:CDP-4-dehydro-6-deoxyglucose reductase